MARPVPADLEDALADHPTARERFWAMPSEQKDAWVAYVARGRFPGARRRRVSTTVRRLGGSTVVERNGAGPPPIPSDASAWLLGLALLGGVAALIVWLAVFRHHDRQTTPTAVVVTAKATVPKVTSIRFQSAEFQLKQSKLSARVVRRSAAKPRGIVIGQRPKPRTLVPQGTIVVLLVSNGPPRVALPDLVGLAAADAVRALQQRQLTPVLRQSPSVQSPGTVLAQRPKAGAHAKPGSRVVLEVAAQQATTQQQTTPQPTTTARQATTTQPATTTQTTTPKTTTAGAGLSPPPSGNDYTGMQLGDAVQRLADGSQRAIVVYVVSAKQPAGVVVANRPSGSRERLAVSMGPQPKPQDSVPDVTGEDAATAQQDLQSAGFSAITVDWPVSDSAQDGVVVAEAPARGATVPRGATVVLYIGSSVG